jgi:hypothetical protein
MKLINFFLFLLVLFAFLVWDPDPDCRSGYVSRDPIESGSNSDPDTDPDPQHRFQPLPFPNQGGQGTSQDLIPTWEGLEEKREHRERGGWTRRASFLAYFAVQSSN